MILITFLKTGRISYNMLKYIPVLAQIAYQGHLHSIETKRKYADDSYKIKKVIEFNVQLTEMTILISKCTFCFPIKIKSTTDEDKDIAASTITVNIVFLIGLRKLIPKDMETTCLFYC